MKYYSLFILAFTSVLLASCHQKHEGHQDGERQHQHDHDDDHDHQEDHDHHQNSRTSTFDAELAEKLGADEYGMSQYVIAFLKSGPNRSQDSITAAQMQRAHLDNINRLAEEGMIALAGPFLDDTDLRGIYIFNVSSVVEAAELTASDPMIQEGRLVMELHPWYGSAALKQVNDWHPKVAKKEI